MELFVFFIGFGCGWFALRYLVMAKARRIFKEVGLNLDEPIEVAAPPEIKKIAVDFEIRDNMIYCYDRESQQFLAQGLNYLDIKQALEDRFPNTSFTCKASHLTMMEEHESV
jgi:hypothetical protein